MYVIGCFRTILEVITLISIIGPPNAGPLGPGTMFPLYVLSEALVTSQHV